MDDHHLSNITKLNKKLLFPSHLGYKQNLLKKTQNRTATWWVEKDSKGLTFMFDHHVWRGTISPPFHGKVCITQESMHYTAVKCPITDNGMQYAL
jgi:hypothetical protein